MKATISQDGTLNVAAESELEAYALDRWADGYFGQDDAATRKSKLVIYPVASRAAPAHPGERKEGKEN